MKEAEIGEVVASTKDRQPPPETRKRHGCFYPEPQRNNGPGEPLSFNFWSLEL